jgi:hypothetical protein
MERGLQNLPVFLFRTAIVLGRTLLECHHKVCRKIAHNQLGHGRAPEVIGDLNGTAATGRMIALLSQKQPSAEVSNVAKEQATASSRVEVIYDLRDREMARLLSDQHGHITWSVENCGRDKQYIENPMAWRELVGCDN